MARQHHNLNRRIAPMPTTAAEKAELKDLSERAVYVGNPAHKRNPGDYGLTPPSGPRSGKTLCDVVEVFSRAEAQKLLATGIEQGLVSTGIENGWPRMVWTIKGDTVLEARLDNVERGTYHGYPLVPTDPFCASVQARWVKP
jgi:hypothetical protein